MYPPIYIYIYIYIYTYTHIKRGDDPPPKKKRIADIFFQIPIYPPKQTYASALHPALHPALLPALHPALAPDKTTRSQDT